MTLKKHLEENGVGCALHYPLPLHLQKCYANLGYKEGAFPVSEKAARECLSLPIYPELTDAQIQRVAEVIKDFFKKNCNRGPDHGARPRLQNLLNPRCQSSK